MKKLVLLSICVLTSCFSSFQVCAAPIVLPDKTTFDSDYYANTYPDIVEILGNDENTLYNHFVNYGRYEGRIGAVNEVFDQRLNTILSQTDTPAIVEKLAAAFSVHDYIKEWEGDDKNIIYALPSSIGTIGLIYSYAGLSGIDVFIGLGHSLDATKNIHDTNVTYEMFGMDKTIFTYGIDYFISGDEYVSYHKSPGWPYYSEIQTYDHKHYDSIEKYKRGVTGTYMSAVSRCYRKVLNN